MELVLMFTSLILESLLDIPILETESELDTMPLTTVEPLPLIVMVMEAMLLEQLEEPFPD